MSEQEIEKVLRKLKRDGAWVTLSLHPGIGESTISKDPKNRLFINEGRSGKWEGVSEAFYDEMVNRFDSRYKRK
jgi:hypothetical protein